MREAIDKKEEEIMKYLEKNETDYDSTNELIHNSQEMLSEIPSILENVNDLLIKCDNKKLTVDTAEEVLSIKEKMDNVEKVREKLKSFENCETFINTENFLKGMKRGLDEINSVQEIPMKRVLCSAPTGFAVEYTYSVFVSFHWDKKRTCRRIYYLHA